MTDRKKFLPINQADLKERGWSECDIILITGDAYVDHPSYGAAVIGRHRVMVVSMPVAVIVAVTVIVAAHAWLPDVGSAIWSSMSASTPLMWASAAE